MDEKCSLNSCTEAGYGCISVYVYEKFLHSGYDMQHELTCKCEQRKWYFYLSGINREKEFITSPHIQHLPFPLWTLIVIRWRLQRYRTYNSVSEGIDINTWEWLHPILMKSNYITVTMNFSYALKETIKPSSRCINICIMYIKMTTYTNLLYIHEKRISVWCSDSGWAFQMEVKG